MGMGEFSFLQCWQEQEEVVGGSGKDLGKR
jgi:hypothetical protein